MKTGILLKFILGLLLASLPRLAHADDLLDDWTLRSPLPTGNNLSSIAFGNGLYVAVGGAGTILTSPDGTNWTRCAAGTNGSFFGVVFGNGQFVAVGSGIVKTAAPLPGMIMTSHDGITWTTRVSNATRPLSSVAYGGGRFVAVGVSGGIAVTSTNGADWTAATITGVSLPRGVGFGNGLFVAVGQGGALATSTNGTTWTARNSGTDITLFCVTHGNGLFVAAGGAGGTDSPIVTSPDGVTWTPRVSGVAGRIFGCSYSGSRFVAVAQGSIDTALVSSNGINWSSQSVPFLANSVVAGNGLFVAVGPLGTIVTSANGQVWNRQSSALFYSQLADMSYGKGLFVAPTFGAVFTSPDGNEWTAQTAGITESILNGVAFGQDLFVAVGQDLPGQAGLIFASSNGVHWVRWNSGTTFNLTSVAYGNGHFVAVGADSFGQQHTIITSTNGSNWTVRASGTPVLNKVAYGNGVFAAVGASGAIRTSTNAINWTSRASGSAVTLQDIAFGGGRFVAVGYEMFETTDSMVTTSQDGITWSARPLTSRTNGYVESVAFGNGVFAALELHTAAPGSGPIGYSIRSSTDGTNWIQRASEVNEPAQRIRYGNGRLIAFGSTILTCDIRPRLGPVALLPDSSGSVPVTGISGLRYTLETSTNLTDWSALSSALLPNGTGTFTNLSVGNSDRFYRAASQP